MQFFLMLIVIIFLSFQCFHTVGWMTGRPSGLYNSHAVIIPKRLIITKGSSEQDSVNGEMISKVKKSKVDDLYRGSKRSRSLQNRYYNTHLVHWTHAWQPHNWRVSMKALARYQIILLGDRGTLVCEQLAQSRCLTMHQPGIKH